MAWIEGVEGAVVGAAAALERGLAEFAVATGAGPGLVAAMAGAGAMLALVGLARVAAFWGRSWSGRGAGVSREPTPSAPVADPVQAALVERIAGIADGQQRLAGALSQGLTQIGELGAKAQVETAERAAQSFGAIAERLEAIDRAQAKLERLSGDVLGLQDILADKQTRGRFGEIQLNELIADALPPSAFALQATLSNGRRADALIFLPNPPGPIAVDAKFPLEPYETFREARRSGASAEAQASAARGFRQAIKTHVDAIAERYVVPGETADGAIMFLPSEAVFAELHGGFADLVRASFQKRVWIVSPTTLMATLMSMRAALQHMRLEDGAAELRREIALLAADVERLAERSDKLRSAFAQAQRSLDEIGVSAEKSLKRARRLIDGGTPERATENPPPTEPIEPDRPSLGVGGGGASAWRLRRSA